MKDLQSRLMDDFINIRPTWISILIGVNDCWRRYDSNDPTTTDEFEERYRDVLTKLKQNLNAKIVLCEPFLLHVRPELGEWREDLDPKIDVVRKLAREYETYLVPLDGTHSPMPHEREALIWAEDGVHPKLQVML